MNPGSKRIRVPAGDGHPQFFERIGDKGQLPSAVTLLLLATCIALASCHPATKHNVEPEISFTQVPEWSTGDRDKEDVIEGTVRGAKQGQRMVLYSKCGGLWWLQ